MEKVYYGVEAAGCWLGAGDQIQCFPQARTLSTLYPRSQTSVPTPILKCFHTTGESEEHLEVGVELD